MNNWDKIRKKIDREIEEAKQISLEEISPDEFFEAWRKECIKAIEEKTFPRKMICSNNPNFPDCHRIEAFVIVEVPSIEYPFLIKGDTEGSYIGFKYIKEIDK